MIAGNRKSGRIANVPSRRWRTARTLVLSDRRGAWVIVCAALSLVHDLPLRHTFWSGPSGRALLAERRTATHRTLLRVCLHPSLMRHALPAILAVRRCDRLAGRLRDLSTLQPKPTLHLLKPKVWWGVDGLEHDAGYGFVLGLGGTAEARAFTNHAVLEVTNLHDAFPVGRPVLGELSDLGLQDVSIDERGARREKNLIPGREVRVEIWK